MSQSDDIWEAVSDESLGKSALAVRVSFGQMFLRTVRLEPDVTYLGRMPENHVAIDDPKASRSHARILAKDGEFVLEDQKSENGTYVNKHKISEHPLVIGDIIQIGSHILEVVEASPDEAKEAEREQQLETAEEEEWRMDRTINMSPDTLERIQSEMAQGRKGAESTKKKPKMKFKIEAGEKKFEKEIVFEKARKREFGPLDKNEVQVRVLIGKWILEKKIDL